MVKNSFLLFVLGLILGFAVHNSYSCYRYQKLLTPKVQVIKKNKFEIARLPYRAAEDPDFNISPFQIPEYNVVETPSIPVTAGRNQETVARNTNAGDLEYRLNRAVHESEAEYRVEEEVSEVGSYTINDLPSNIQMRIPSFVYGSHVFSSNNRDRFISLNGKNYHEGDLALGIMTVVKIQPNYTICRIDGTSFTIPSLSDWKAK